MPVRSQTDNPATLIKGWSLQSGATLGSSVRAKGILLEVRAQLPLAARKLIKLEQGTLALRLPENAPYEDFQTVLTIVETTLASIDDLPVIPREIEDILAISTAERHRWLKDGRLQSAGTRTVKLRGRARRITFHVFDPRHVEDVLDRDLVTAWREDDALAAADNRRRAAAKASLKRARKKAPKAEEENRRDHDSAKVLLGWDEFESDGLLR